MSWRTARRAALHYGPVRAAHALSLDVILVTHNQREFSRVADLQIDNWIGRTTKLLINLK